LTVFNLGMGEITVIVLLALIFIGPKKLPELASGLGKLIREIRKTTSDVKNEIQLDEAIRKPFEELREAVTLHPEELKRRDRIRQELEAARRAAVEAEKLIAEAAALAAVPGQDGIPASGEDGSVVAPAGAETSVASDVAASTAATVPEGRAALPTPGVTPPIGTVPREPSPPLASSPGASSLPPSLKRPLTSPKPFGGSAASHREPTRGLGASQLPADSAADRSNTTQALTEADLAAVVGTPPPPPPGSVRTGRTYPPPAPALPGATAAPSARASSGKSAPLTAVPAPASTNASRSGPVTGPVPADRSKSGPLASAPPPPAAEEASEKKPAPST
jgi:sec-independent protein translocase protein TatB